MTMILANLMSFFTGDMLIVILLFLLLFYGRNLPSVGRSLGKGISEFKKGLKGLEDDVEGTSPPVARNEAPQIEAPRPPQRIGAPVPKFEAQPEGEKPQP
jgi:sec-independent protein translocase protein TatA